MLALEVAVEEEEVGGADWSAATAEWSDVIVGGVRELSLLLLSFAVGVAAFSLAAAARSLLADDDGDMLLLWVMRVYLFQDEMDNTISRRRLGANKLSLLQC